MSCESTNETKDVFSYTRRDEFTSETLKIEIRNLPKHVGYDTLKKLLKRLDLKPLKIKLIGRAGSPTHSFVTFRTSEDREQAINQLDQYLWKQNVLVVKTANPIPDPLVEKRNERRSEDNCDSKRIKTLEGNEVSAEQLADTLNDKIASLWRMSYSQQLVVKYDILKAFLLSLNKELAKIVSQSSEQSSQLSLWLTRAAKEFDNKCCPLQDIRVSTLINGYRNKCEFTIGIDKTVGFRLGLYKEGTVKVISPPINCPIIGDQMRNALNAIQTYVTSKSTLHGFDPETHSGHWIQSTVRTSSTGSMVIMALNPQQLTPEEINREKTQIIDFFQSNPDFGVHSVFIHISSKRHEISNECIDHLFGESTISETINLEPTLTFRISPLAFFQINTLGAELCYKAICDLIEPNAQLILIDICCGTGTIGLSLASKVKKVFGIELNADAIRDAKFNAQLNAISNVEFIEGKAESMIASVLQSCGHSPVVAVVDPPRAGLNNSIIRALRSHPLLKRLVYVSCEPNKAIKNLIDLCRPPSKTYKGQPFVPIQAIPVDLFPHTNRCELLLLFERLETNFVDFMS
ncbi:unnamed protein product [Medioppia subpectinata]|uniref:tRNA (uracil(54)-C(5))-methyltransferase n=1 Tax=Medioppia subpectinata TaxID=1979941 RepID=A0A7R9PXX4_9ACAR|nr:unnamed protein product [Medioppia subpectinata]CAG2105280.1 unnamed protein product [Medioppia subpectinata]